MNRAEIIEGLKEIYDRFYAFTDYRETLEACLELLENENALIDRVLEIIDSSIEDVEALEVGRDGAISAERKEAMLLEATAIRTYVVALKGGAE
ncbi:MAG: hypothetical protein IJP92_02745 [Lachnospiraceae bacterium]|nr:hypothetical protein [Lachnospiraceae bacterium]